MKRRSEDGKSGRLRWVQPYLLYTGIAMELSVANVLEQMTTADRLHFFLYQLTSGVSLTSSLCLDKSMRAYFVQYVEHSSLGGK